MENIKLLPLDDLLHEILSRFDHAIFIGIKSLHGINNEQDTTPIETIRKWVGNSYTIAGMAIDGARIVMDEYHDREEPTRG